MLHVRRICLSLLLFLLILIYLIAASNKEKRPWLETNKDDDVPSVTEEMLGAVENPLNYFASRTVIEGNEDVISDIANYTYVMLYIPASKVYSSAPLHLLTTLRRFPNHHIYSDIGAKIGEVMVDDAVADLPLDTIKTDGRLNSYRIQRFGTDNNFNWPIKDYWVGSNESDSLMDLLSWNIFKKAYSAASPQMNWFVLMDEGSYISSQGLEKLLLNVNAEEKIAYIADRPSGPGRQSLVLSKAALEFLLEREKSDQMNESAIESIVSESSNIRLTPIRTRNLSTLGINAENWCVSFPSIFTGLEAWEIQSLYHREMMYRNDSSSNSSREHVMFNFFRDYIMPYVVKFQGNWVIYPSGPYYSNSTSVLHETLNPHLDREHCVKMCELNDKCLAWQWRKDTSCGLETYEIKRGMAFNPKHIGWEGPKDTLYVSGWMVDRIKKIRMSSGCGDVEDQDTLMQNEGWFRTIRSLIKLEGSEVLQSIRRYNTPH